MLLRKHTALQIVCLYAMVTAVCVLGPALSARRHNSQKGEHQLQKIAGTTNHPTSLKTAKNVLTTEQVVARRRNENSFGSKSFEKNTIPGFTTAGNFIPVATGDYSVSVVRIVKTYSPALRPAYYTFLFRYTPF